MSGRFAQSLTQMESVMSQLAECIAALEANARATPAKNCSKTRVSRPATSKRAIIDEDAMETGPEPGPVPPTLLSALQLQRGNRLPDTIFTYLLNVFKNFLIRIKKMPLFNLVDYYHLYF